MNLPNKLTVLRIFLVPIMVVLFLFPYASYGIELPELNLFNMSIEGRYFLIFIIFCLASFTDYLDGEIARKKQLITTFGKFLDPIADKLLVNTLLLLLASDGSIPILVVIIMISRDTMVDAIRFFAASKKRVQAARFLGKLKTVTQMIAIILLLLQNAPFAWLNLPLDMIMLYIATIVSVISGVDYFIENKDVLLESM